MRYSDLCSIVITLYSAIQAATTPQSLGTLTSTPAQATRESRPNVNFWRYQIPSTKMLLEFHAIRDAGRIDALQLGFFIVDARAALVVVASRHGGMDEGMQEDFEHYHVNLYGDVHGNYHQPHEPPPEWPTYRDADRVLLAIRTELRHLEYQEAHVVVFRLNERGAKVTQFMDADIELLRRERATGTGKQGLVMTMGPHDVIYAHS
ncbi:MAG: hypothetical protein Q9167_003799 [Letrouitia subvulpina]